MRSQNTTIDELYEFSITKVSIYIQTSLALIVHSTSEFLSFHPSPACNWVELTRLATHVTLWHLRLRLHKLWLPDIFHRWHKELKILKDQQQQQWLQQMEIMGFHIHIHFRAPTTCVIFEWLIIGLWVSRCCNARILRDQFVILCNNSEQNNVIQLFVLLLWATVELFCY